MQNFQHIAKPLFCLRMRETVFRRVSDQK